MRNAPIYNFPLKYSEPEQFVFKQTVQLNTAGNFLFPINKQRFTPDLILEDEAVYYLRTLTFGGDVAAEHYTMATIIEPVFHLYLESEAGAPQLKNPIALPIYFHNQLYQKLLEPTVLEGDGLLAGTNRFLGSFEGTIQQIPPLIGKTALTLTMIITAQEITDETFIAELKKTYKGTS